MKCTCRDAFHGKCSTHAGIPCMCARAHPCSKLLRNDGTDCNAILIMCGRHLSSAIFTQNGSEVLLHVLTPMLLLRIG